MFITPNCINKVFCGHKYAIQYIDVLYRLLKRYLCTFDASSSPVWIAKFFFSHTAVSFNNQKVVFVMIFVFVAYPLVQQFSLIKSKGAMNALTQETVAKEDWLMIIGLSVVNNPFKIVNFIFLRRPDIRRLKISNGSKTKFRVITIQIVARITIFAPNNSLIWGRIIIALWGVLK